MTKHIRKYLPPSSFVCPSTSHALPAKDITTHAPFPTDIPSIIASQKHKLTGNTLSEVVIEPLEGVTNERQAHLGRLLDNGRPSLLDRLRLEQRCVVGLVDLVRGEVCCVDVGCQAGLEGCADATQAVELDAAEEGMTLDLMGATATNSVLAVADETVWRVSYCSYNIGEETREAYLLVRLSASTPS